MWFLHFRNNFDISVLDPLLLKIILLNQVSVFVEKFSDLKHDILNSHDV